MVVNEQELPDSPKWFARGEFDSLEACKKGLERDLEDEYSEKTAYYENIPNFSVTRTRDQEIVVEFHSPFKKRPHGPVTRNSLDTYSYRCFPASIDPKGH